MIKINFFDERELFVKRETWTESSKSPRCNPCLFLLNPFLSVQKLKKKCCLLSLPPPWPSMSSSHLARRYCRSIGSFTVSLTLASLAHSRSNDRNKNSDDVLQCRFIWFESVMARTKEVRWSAMFSNLVFTIFLLFDLFLFSYRFLFYLPELQKRKIQSIK